MANRESAHHRDHAGSSAQGLCLRHLPDGGERRRPGALLDRAGTARHHSARRLPYSVAARAHGARDAVHGRGRPRFRRGDRRLRRAAARTRAAPGSTPASAGSIAGCTSAAIATPSRSMTATTLVGGLYGVSLGRAFFGESMFHRARDASKIALVHLVARLRRRRLSAARHAIRHRSPEDLRRGRSAASSAITRCSKQRSIGEGRIRGAAARPRR